MKEWFYENHLHGCGRMFLTFTYKLCKKQGGMYYTTKCYMVENGLTECALEGNPGKVDGVAPHVSNLYDYVNHVFKRP
jgi:hypothetical protein